MNNLQLCRKDGQPLGYIHYYSIATKKALDDLSTVPAVLQSLLEDLYSLEQSAIYAKSQSNTRYTHLCNHIQALKRFQRQLLTALAISTVPDTS